MIIVAFGANLSSSIGSPQDTYGALPSIFRAHGMRAVSVSSLYRTAPVPVSDQPDYFNAVLLIETDLSPNDTLRALMAIENDLGRTRSKKNAARGVDLDLISYNDKQLSDDASLILPHPRMHERAFVLDPLLEICPKWVHPILGQTPEQLLASLTDKQHAA